jgi:hypothetical protein
MDAPATPVIDTAVLAEDRAHLDRQLAKLDRLSDLGLQIAEGLAAQAKGTGPQVVEGDVALAYDRVARAVRMAVMLQHRLIEDFRLSCETAAKAVAGGDGAGSARARKDAVARIVKRVAEGQGGLDGFQVGWAARQARERLEHDDIYGQVMSQPVSDLVADICRDLGLTPDWARLAEEAWARDEILSGEVGEALQDVLASSPAAIGSAPTIPTLDQRLHALAADPGILAAARGASG